MFPFIVIDPLGNSRFDTNHFSIVRKEFHEGFPRAREFFRNVSGPEKNSVSEAVLGYFRSIARKYPDMPILRVSDDPADALSTIDRLESVDDPETLETRIHEMGSAAMHVLNFEFRKLWKTGVPA